MRQSDELAVALEEPHQRRQISNPDGWRELVDLRRFESSGTQNVEDTLEPRLVLRASNWAMRREREHTPPPVDLAASLELLSRAIEQGRHRVCGGSAPQRLPVHAILQRVCTMERA